VSYLSFARKPKPKPSKMVPMMQKPPIIVRGALTTAQNKTQTMQSKPRRMNTVESFICRSFLG
jgi:hypothetical protein